MPTLNSSAKYLYILSIHSNRFLEITLQRLESLTDLSIPGGRWIGGGVSCGECRLLLGRCFFISDLTLVDIDVDADENK